jgi:hypothetical protein
METELKFVFVGRLSWHKKRKSLYSVEGLRLLWETGSPSMAIAEE